MMVEIVNFIKVALIYALKGDSHKVQSHPNTNVSYELDELTVSHPDEGGTVTCGEVQAWGGSPRSMVLCDDITPQGI